MAKSKKTKKNMRKQYVEGGVVGMDNINIPSGLTNDENKTVKEKEENKSVGAIDIEASQKQLEDIASGAAGPSANTKPELERLIDTEGNIPKDTNVTTVQQIGTRNGAVASQADKVNITASTAGSAAQTARAENVQASTFTSTDITDTPTINAASSAVSKLVEAGQANYDPAIEGSVITNDDIDEGKSLTLEGALSSGSFAEAAQGQNSNIDTGGLPPLEDIDLMSPTVQAQVAELPEEALVSTQMNSLLEGMENGKTPTWALPALTAVEEQLAARGMSASTVGRNALFSAIVSAALPIAQGNALALKERATQNLGNKQQSAILEAQLGQQGSITQFQSTAELQAINAKLANEMGIANLSTDQQTGIYNATSQLGMDMANLTNSQQTALANSKWVQTATLTNVTNDQQATIANATLLAQMDMSNADAITKASIANAQNFLSMDMANLNNEQQASIVNQQSSMQALLSNQAASNAAKQFNASSENQVNTFMANLQTQIASQNTTQQNAMAQFNSAQINQARLQEANINADVSKFNANIDTQVSQFNEQIDYQRSQWNATNAQAVEQSNVNWRRNLNMADTAAANAFNQQNAMNAFQLENGALNNLWQQLRDEAAFEQQSNISYEANVTNLYSTAMSADGKVRSSTINHIKDIISIALTAFANDD